MAEHKAHHTFKRVKALMQQGWIFCAVMDDLGSQACASPDARVPTRQVRTGCGQCSFDAPDVS